MNRKRTSLAPKGAAALKLNDQPAPIDVLFVVAPHSLLLDIAGPAEAFRLVNTRNVEQGKGSQFRLRFVGSTASAPTSVGLPIALEPLPDTFATATWVVIVGQPSVHVLRATPEVLAISHWLSRVLRPRLAAADSADRLLTICSGSLLAARAGL